MAFSSPLIAAAAAFSSSDLGEVSATVDSLIAPTYSPSSGQPLRSILNNDGLPLQLCLSANADKVSVRLIGDPCTGVADPLDRFQRSIRRLRAVIRWTESRTLARYATLTVERTLPTNRGERVKLRHGGLWLAVGISQRKGMALYTTLDWGVAGRCGRWHRVNEWLESILPAGTRVIEQLGLLPLLAWPISAGLEGSSYANAVAKVYVRLDEPVPLGNMGLDCFASPEFRAFSERILAGRTLPATGMLLCAGFAIASGRMVSAKLDFCGHCVPRSPKEWQDTIDHFALHLGVRPMRVDPLLTKRLVDVAFIGLGRTLPGSHRVNLYLKAITNAEAQSS